MTAAESTATVAELEAKLTARVQTYTTEQLKDLYENLRRIRGRDIHEATVFAACVNEFFGRMTDDEQDAYLDSIERAA